MDEQAFRAKVRSDLARARQVPAGWMQAMKWVAWAMAALVALQVVLAVSTYLDEKAGRVHSGSFVDAVQRIALSAVMAGLMANMYRTSRSMRVAADLLDEAERSRAPGNLQLQTPGSPPQP